MFITRIIFIVFTLFSSFAFADDAWITCLQATKNICVTNGWTPSFSICDRWVGEDEACISCMNGPVEERAQGCGGPGYGSLPTNIRAMTCPDLQPKHSVINQTSSSFSETIPIVGSDVSLVFSSDRGLRRTDNYRLKIPLYKNPPTSFTDFDVRINIAGRNISQTLDASTNTHLDWVWDGLNSASQPTPGGAVANVKIYLGLYSPSATPIEFSLPLGNWKVDSLGLGGWTLSNNHFYDRTVGRLYLGSGGTLEADYEDMGGGNYAVSIDSNSEIYVFNSNGRHLQTLAALTGQVLASFNYDGSGRITRYTDAYGRQTLINRTSGVFTGVQTPYGVLTSVSINGAGYLASVTNPNSESYTMTYTGSGMLSTFTKPAGEITTFTTDADGNLTSDAHSGGEFLSYLKALVGNSKKYTRSSAVGRNESIEVVNATTYSESKSINSLGSVSSVKEIYGPEGSIVSTIGNVKTTTSFTFDPRFGNLVRQPAEIVEQSGSLNRSSIFTYDANIPDPDDPFTIINMTVEQAVNSRNYVGVYTGATKKWIHTSPEGRTQEFILNAYQKPTSAKVGILTALTMQYDGWGRLSSVTQGARVTEFTYDAKGFVASVKNPLLQTTSYAYDLAGRVTSVTLPDTRVIGYAYDSNGRVTGITPPGKPQHGFFYNALEVLQKYLPPVLGGIPKPVEYVYNNDKQMTRADRSDGTSVFFNYGSVTGVLDSISTSASTLFSYTYETTKGLLASASSYDNLLNTFTYNGSLLTNDVLTSSSVQVGKVSFSYDSNFWTTGITVEGGSASTPLTTSFSHDDDGLITAAGSATYAYQSAAPLLATMTLGSSGESFSYSSFGELSGRTVTYASAPVYGNTYTRDALGRVATKTETFKGVSHVYGYTYDVSGRLTDVTRDSVAYAHFDFDTNGNRTGGNVGASPTTATYDNQDRILTYNNYTYTHNDNGEITGRHHTPSGATTSYQYDALGTLTQVTLPTSDVITYIHDGLGRRVGRKKNGVTTDTFLYNGQYNIVADLDGFGNIKTQYVYVSDSHSPDFMVRSGVTYKLVKDHLGSVRLVMRISDGVIVQRIDYDIFGAVTLDSNTCFQPFGFAGGLRDQDTKLLHFGAREYDPEIARWTSKDPILFDGEDENLYGYALSDPVNFHDPDGLSAGLLVNTRELDGAGAGAVAGTIAAGAVIDLVGHEISTGWNYICNLADEFKKDIKWKKQKSEHTKNKSPSNKNKHEKGQRTDKINKGGEKGDKYRPYRRK